MKTYTRTHIQGVEDIFMDFYIKEALNGCIKFESVAYPGQFVHLQSRGGAFSDFSVYLLVPKSCYTILCCYSLPDYHTCMQSVSSSRIVRRLCTCCHVDTGYEQGHRKGPQKNHPKVRQYLSPGLCMIINICRYALN